MAAAREPVVVDVSGLADGVGGTKDGDSVKDGAMGGLAAVAALARLRLAARRTGHRVRLKGVGPGLRELLELSGLAGEFEWEPEEGEEPAGVQE